MLFNVNHILEWLVQMLFNKYLLEKNFIRHKYGIVITNSVFTEQAERLAEEIGVILWDRNKLKDLLEEAGGGTIYL